jgi:hypothetical protein
VIQPADPNARRRAIVAVAIIGVLAVAAYIAAEDWLAALRARPPGEARQAFDSAIRWGTVFVTVPIVLIALYIFWLGRRVVSAQRFPPPGIAVVRDTVVLEGRPARIRGYVIQGLAAALTVAAATLPVAAFKVASLLR